jgi:hypothetical protein
MLAIARTYKSRMEARPFVRQIMPRRRKRCEKRFSRNLCSAVAGTAPGELAITPSIFPASKPAHAVAALACG